MIADIVPIPVLGLICMFILLFRPPWFKEMVDAIYAIESRTDKHWKLFYNPKHLSLKQLAPSLRPTGNIFQ